MNHRALPFLFLTLIAFAWGGVAFAIDHRGSSVVPPSSPSGIEEIEEFRLQRLIALSTIDGNVIRIRVEIAQTPREWERGFMGQSLLEGNHGILFDFREERPIATWMKNRSLPLDIIFINGKGKVISMVENAEPLSEKIISAPEPARYVLEIKGGSVAKWEISLDSKILMISR